MSGIAASRSEIASRPLRAIAFRVAIAVLATLVVAALAVIYPLSRRGSEWFEVSFQYPWLLLLLVVVPIVWWWGTFGQDRRKPRLRIGTIAPLIKGPRGARAHLRDMPGVLRAVAVTFLILAIARPVSVLRTDSGEQKGIDIVLVLDLSNSMAAVLDGDPRDLPGYE